MPFARRQLMPNACYGRTERAAHDMIGFIIRQSIRYPGVVVALALTLVVY
ncbi:MAG: hypothetical protein KIS79_14890 [Burkholderiales bacterium]|nr:hypothetical protein [Burkholderiales bacterium]